MNIKTYKLISMNKTMLEVLANASIDTSDVKYLDMYEDYLRLINEGHKVTYIVRYLSDEYNIAERTIYRIVDKLSSDIDI